mgnify:CR=1 FL=1
MSLDSQKLKIEQESPSENSSVEARQARADATYTKICEEAETQSQRRIRGVQVGSQRQGATAKSYQSSRIPGFAKMSHKQRIQALIDRDFLTQTESSAFLQAEDSFLDQADKFIENCVGAFTLPLGVATNFLIDGREVFIPMAVEESSVVAAASFGAKLARSCGGFFSSPAESIATCQVQFFTDTGEQNPPLLSDDLKHTIKQNAESLFPKLLGRGGGVKDIELRNLAKPGVHVLHIHVDTCDAMGANIVNTIAEEIGRILPKFIPCRVGSKILTNLTVHRLTKVRCEIEPELLEREGFSCEEALQRICEVWEFAYLDPFRAATHNKGIMNGIDPVVIATGNDWRAVEAGCHAYASVSGSYKPLTHWFVNAKGKLEGNICVPIAVGTVGGMTRLHPAAKASLKLLGYPTASELSSIIASVGLAQNISALRALACEGIQKGHMALHEKNMEMMRRYDHVPPISVISNK